MTQITTDNWRRLRTPVYLVLGCALLFAIVDFILAVAPLQLGNVMWRFGAVGLSANAVVTPLVIASLLYALSIVSEDRGILMAVGILAALFAFYLLIASGSFALDALQMRSRVNPAAKDKFVVASAVAGVKLVVECVISLLLAIGAFRANRASRRVVARNTRQAAPIIGARGTAVPAQPVITERDAGGVTP
jgi:hypothetical protein